MDVDIIDGELETVHKISKKKAIYLMVGAMILTFMLIFFFRLDLPNRQIQAKLDKINNEIIIKQTEIDNEIINLYLLLDKLDKLDKTSINYLENKELLQVEIKFSKSRLENSRKLVEGYFRQKFLKLVSK